MKIRPIGEKQAQPLYELSVFNFFWYLFAVAIFFVARGFDFPLKFFLRFEFIIFILPQAIFVVSYALWVRRTYFPRAQVLITLFCLLLILASLHNLERLNNWRGGWGSVFLGYDSARAYVDEHEDYALLVIPSDHLPPFVFTSANEVLMLPDQTNMTLLKEYSSNHTAVFIAARIPLDFNQSDAVPIPLTLRDSSPYGRLISLLQDIFPSERLRLYLSKHYTNSIFLYQLKNNSKNNHA